MDDTQNQNSAQTDYNQPAPQPDYGFINGYADPAPPKKKGPKLSIAVFLVVLLVGVGVLALLAPSRSNNTPPTQPRIIADVTSSQSAAADVAETLLAPMREGNLDKAYEVYVKDKVAISKEFFRIYTYEPLLKRTEFRDCKFLSDTTNEQNVTTVGVQCSGKDTYGDQVIAIAFKRQDGNTIEYRSIIAYNATAYEQGL